MRGLSPVVGVVLLIAIAVVAAVGVWFWVGSYSSASSFVGVNESNAYLVVESFNGSSAFLRNLGESGFSGLVSVYNDSGVLVGFFNVSGLGAGESKRFDFNLSVGELYRGTYFILGSGLPKTTFVLKQDYLPPIYRIYVAGDTSNYNISCLYLNGSLDWSFDAEAAIPASVAVKDGIVYSSSDHYGAFALNAINGSLLWNYSKYNVAEVGPFVDGGLVYYPINTQSEGALFLALNTSLSCSNESRLVWAFPNTTSSELADACAVEVNNKVFFSDFSNEKTYILNASTGEHILNYTMKDGTESSLLVYNNTMYFGDKGGNFYAVNTYSGNDVWSPVSFGADISSSPILVNGVLYFGVESPTNATVAVYASNGSVKWNYNISCGGVTLSSPFYSNGKVYIGYDCSHAGDPKLVVLNASNGVELWNVSSEIQYGVESSPVVFKGVVYVGDGGGYLHAINASGSHNQLWSYKTGSRISSAVICNERNWKCIYSPITGMNNTAS